jgi:hypothetical protein
MPHNLQRQNPTQNSITPKPLKNWGVRTVSGLLMTVTSINLAVLASPQEATGSGLEPASLAAQQNRDLSIIAQSNIPTADPAGKNSSTASSQPKSLAASPPGEAAANTVSLPTQILRTGVNVEVNTVSPNSLQLAEILKLTPILQKIQTMREEVQRNRSTVTLESLAARQDLNDAMAEATQIIYQCDLGVDFTLAEITAEQNVYQEILGSYTSLRDKKVLYANAISFLTNGGLWALGEAYDIPTYKYPRLSIPSGTISILAGVVPSIASMYALKAVDGKKTTSEVDPNMLAKIFNYPFTPDTDYPAPVWDFLHAIPPHDKVSRKEQLVDRWISDSNIPNFTDRSSKKQLDVLTACVAQKKGLSIATLNTRQVMLTQLGAEIMKMKRLLLELAMVVHGDKRI